MSLPQTDEHNCQTCALKVGETCKRKRKQLIGYCLDWQPRRNKKGSIREYSEQIKSLYESGVSAGQIAKQFGFSRQGIEDHLHSFGVKFRKKKDYLITEETREKLCIARIGEKNPAWKGDKAKAKSGRERARKMYCCPKGKQRHHIDGNPLNNSPENIAIVTPKQHQIIDGRIDNLVKRNKLWVRKALK